VESCPRRSFCRSETNIEKEAQNINCPIKKEIVILFNHLHTHVIPTIFWGHQPCPCPSPPSLCDEYWAINLSKLIPLPISNPYPLYYIHFCVNIAGRVHMYTCISEYVYMYICVYILYIYKCMSSNAYIHVSMNLHMYILTNILPPIHSCLTNGGPP